MNDMDFKALNRSTRYREAGITKRLAYAQYNYASSELHVAQVNERAAELGSQAFEFVANGKLQTQLGLITDREREIALAFVRYAVYGRSDAE